MKAVDQLLHVVLFLFILFRFFFSISAVFLFHSIFLGDSRIFPDTTVNWFLLSLVLNKRQQVFLARVF